MTEAPSRECSPFAEDFTPQKFHSEAGRMNLLKNIRQDLSEGAPIVVVTGDPGCGKSVIGQMLAGESIDGISQIHFSETVVSFEDVVKTVAAAVGLEMADVSRKGVAEAVEAIRGRVVQLSKSLTLIFDGAERIYLATLERIRKMVDKVNIHSVCMQLVFVGRPGLLDNLKQLEICNLNDVPEKRYGLQPLSLSETAFYLEVCTMRLPQVDAGLFTAKVVERIHTASKGNFRKINQCAEEVRKQRDPNASFYVLLDKVDSGETSAGADGRSWLNRSDGNRLSGQTRLLAGGVVAATLAVAVLLLTGGDSENTPQESVPVIEQHAGGATEQVATGQVRGDERGVVIEEPAAPGKPDLEEAVVLAESGRSPEVAVTGVADGAVVEEPKSSQPLEPDSQEISGSVAATADGSAVGVAQDTVEVDGEGVSVILPESGGGAEGIAEDPSDPVESEIVRIEPDQLARKNLSVENDTIIPVPLRKVPMKRIVGDSTSLPAQEENVEGSGVSGASTITVSEATDVLESLSAEEVDKVFQLASEEQSPEPQSNFSEELVVQSELPMDDSAIVLDDSVVEAEALAPDSAEIAAEPKKLIKPVEASFGRINSENVKTKTVPVVEMAVTGSPVTADGSVVRPPLGEAGGTLTSLSESMVNIEVEPEDASAVEGVYQNRLTAGERWLNGANDSKYTMQLMVLSAENARINIERLLDSADYRQEAEKLFIFEGSQTSGEVYVFYGEFDSTEAARAARNNISEPLKEYSPYVLSVPVALQKVQ